MVRIRVMVRVRVRDQDATGRARWPASGHAPKTWCYMGLRLGLGFGLGFTDQAEIRFGRSIRHQIEWTNQISDIIDH